MLSFGKEHRLRRRPEFLACYEEGRRYFSRHFVLFVRFLSGADAPWRVGLAVGRKTGGAVRRNRVRRVLREFFRLHQETIRPAVDIAIVPKRTLDPDRLTLAQATEELLPILRLLRPQQDRAPAPRHRPLLDEE